MEHVLSGNGYQIVAFKLNCLYGISGSIIYFGFVSIEKIDRQDPSSPTEKNLSSRVAEMVQFE